MCTREESGKFYARGLEQLRICELLLKESHAKQLQRETIEAQELRAEALAYRSHGLSLLGEAKAARQAESRGR